MRTVARSAAGLALVAAVGSCGKSGSERTGQPDVQIVGEREKPAGERRSQTAVQVVGERETPAELIWVTIETDESRVGEDILIPATTVRAQLPRGWRALPKISHIWAPHGQDPGQIRLEVTTSCGGSCEEDRIAHKMIGETERDLMERWVLGDEVFGKTQMPALEPIARGELPRGGRYLAYRYRFPLGSEEQADWGSHTYLECYLRNQDDPFFVLLAATATIEKEAVVWPVLLDSCRSATYSTETGTDGARNATRVQ